MSKRNFVPTLDEDEEDELEAVIPEAPLKKLAEIVDYLKDLPRDRRVSIGFFTSFLTSVRPG